MSEGDVQTIELDSPPSLTSLYARAVVAPVLPGGRDELLDRRLELRGAEMEAEHVAAYSRVCGFGVRSVVPGTYPHVLAFPLQMSLMTERSFPFSVIGLVHIANRIDVLQPIPMGSSVDFAVWAEDLREHRRGRQFDMVAEAEIEGATAWRGRSTYLRPGGGSDSPRSDGDEEREPAGELSVSAEWDIPGDIGRRYAAVSGDRNPIHMHSLSARLFGFPIVRGAHAGDVHGRSRVQVTAEDPRQGDAAERPPRRRLGVPAGEPGRRAGPPDRIAQGLTGLAVIRPSHGAKKRSRTEISSEL